MLFNIIAALTKSILWRWWW